MRVRWKPERCYACGSCQLACSYHRTGAFQPSQSSIRVLRDPIKGSISWNLDSSLCDGCAGTDEPLCIHYCTYGAIGYADQDAPGRKDADHV